MARRVNYGGEAQVDYTGQATVDAPVFTFSKGMVTDASPLGMPPDSALDIRNFELLIDGSVRRRRACARENDHILRQLTGDRVSHNNDQFVWTKWRTIMGRELLVGRIGYFLHFWYDQVDLSQNYIGALVDLRQFKAGNVDHSDVLSTPVSLCIINGDLVVSGGNIDSFYVRDRSNTFYCYRISPVIRQFIDRKDSIQLDHAPNVGNGEYTSTHRYNLRNRGWHDFTYDDVPNNSDGIYKYIDASSPTAALCTAPAKTMAMSVGQVPLADGGATQDRWYFYATKVMSYDFGLVSAPRGHIKHYLYSNHSALALTQLWKSYTKSTAPYKDPINQFHIDTWSTSTPFSSLGTRTITIYILNDICRGGRPGAWPTAGIPYNINIQIYGNTFLYTSTTTGSTVYEGTMDGDYNATLISRSAGPPGTGAFTFTYTCPINFSTDISPYEKTGAVYLPFSSTHPLNTTATASAPETHITGADISGLSWDTNNGRCAVNASFAGRLWLANLQSDGTYPDASAFFHDKVFFSKIIYEDTDYNIFHQVNDPTSGIVSNLLPSDGGYIEISGLGQVTKMVTIQDHLWVFSTNGVWEIAGSQGFFAADNISIRKLSDVGTVKGGAVNSVIGLEDTAMMISPRGLYAISQDRNSGYPTLVSITEGVIQNWWDLLDPIALQSAQLVYDEGLKRVHMLYWEPDDETEYLGNGYPLNRMLIYDMRLKAYYVYSVGTMDGEKMIGAMYLTKRTNTSMYLQMKYINIFEYLGNTYITVCDMAENNQASINDDFYDYSNVDSTPYIITAYDSTPKDWQRQRQALYVTTYMKRTETSYDPPTNESYLTMAARWDWSDHVNSGKFDAGRQIYKHLRPYTPSGPTDVDDGVPVIVCKNKIRGTGKSLHFKFTGSQTKDAHLLGWSVHYKASRRL